MWFRLATDVKESWKRRMFKFKVIPEGVMTAFFPVEGTFLSVDRRSINYHNPKYRSSL